MDEYLSNFKKKKKNFSYENNKIRKKSYKNVLSRFLLAIIFFLVSIIFTNMSDKNLLLYKEYVLTESLPFTKIKHMYEDLFGEVLPDAKTEMVFNDTLVYKSIDKYADGEVLNVNSNSIVSNLNGGIVVFNGVKDDYGNTVIIQGNDGVDIWYGNLKSVSVKLYDYLEKGTVLGEVDGENLYLVIKKDNEFIKFEDYKN